MHHDLVRSSIGDTKTYVLTRLDFDSWTWAFYLRSLSLGCSSQLRKLGSLLRLLNLEDGGLYFRPWTLGPRTWESCARNLRSKCALLPVKATSHFLYYYFFILNFIIVIMF